VTCGFVVLDWVGRPVELRHGNWQRHLAKRPYMAQYHGALRAVIADPDFVIEDPQTGAAHCYRAGLGHGAHRRCYLKVIVLYSSSGKSGVVATAFMIRLVRPQGKMLWTRPRKI
jgi:hypothetical protein